MKIKVCIGGGDGSRWNYLKVFMNKNFPRPLAFYVRIILYWNSMHHFFCHWFEWARNEKALQHNWGFEYIRYPRFSTNCLLFSFSFLILCCSMWQQQKKLFRLIMDTIKLEYICIIFHKGVTILGSRHSVIGISNLRRGGIYIYVKYLCVRFVKQSLDLSAMIKTEPKWGKNTSQNGIMY